MRSYRSSADSTARSPQVDDTTGGGPGKRTLTEQITPEPEVSSPSSDAGAVIASAEERLARPGYRYLEPFARPVVTSLRDRFDPAAAARLEQLFGVSKTQGGGELAAAKAASDAYHAQLGGEAIAELMATPPSGDPAAARGQLEASGAALSARYRPRLEDDVNLRVAVAPVASKGAAAIPIQVSIAPNDWISTLTCGMVQPRPGWWQFWKGRSNEARDGEQDPLLGPDQEDAPASPVVAPAVHDDGAPPLAFPSLADDAASVHSASHVPVEDPSSLSEVRRGKLPESAPRAAGPVDDGGSASGSGEHAELYGRWEARGLERKTIERYLESPEALGADPEIGLQRLVDRAHAVEVWVQGTEELRGKTVKVSELLGADGKNNHGVFVVHDETSNKSYIVKAVNPGALSQFTKLEPLNDRPQGADEDYPKFAKYVDSGNSEGISDQTFKRANPSFGLLEKAQGEPLSKIHDDWAEDQNSVPDIQQIYEQVARSMGAMAMHAPKIGNRPAEFVSRTNKNRFETRTHNDMNPSNVFYDRETSGVTLIDNDGVTENGGYGAMSRDVSDLFLPMGAIADRAGTERAATPDEAGLLPGEVLFQNELQLFNAFARAYLGKTAKLAGFNEQVMIAQLTDIRQGRTNAYGAKARADEAAVRLRFPEAFLALP